MPQQEFSGIPQMGDSLFRPSMSANELRLRTASGVPVFPDTDTADALEEYGRRARWITTYLNSVPHEPHIVREILHELTQYSVHETVNVLTPFLCAIGINLHFGKDIQIGQSCNLLDQSVIRIDDRCIIEDGVIVITAARSPRLDERGILRPSPVHIEHDVWLGAGCTIMPGILIGARSVVLPGSSVMCDVPPGVIVGGVPAQYVRDI